MEPVPLPAPKLRGHLPPSRPPPAGQPYLPGCVAKVETDGMRPEFIKDALLEAWRLGSAEPVGIISWLLSNPRPWRSSSELGSTRVGHLSQPSQTLPQPISSFGELWDINPLSDRRDDVSFLQARIRCPNVHQIPELLNLMVDDRRFRIPIEIDSWEEARPILLGEDLDRRLGLDTTENRRRSSDKLVSALSLPPFREELQAYSPTRWGLAVLCVQRIRTRWRTAARWWTAVCARRRLAGLGESGGRPSGPSFSNSTRSTCLGIPLPPFFFDAPSFSSARPSNSPAFWGHSGCGSSPDPPGCGRGTQSSGPIRNTGKSLPHPPIEPATEPTVSKAELEHTPSDPSAPEPDLSFSEPRPELALPPSEPELQPAPSEPELQPAPSEPELQPAPSEFDLEVAPSPEPNFLPRAPEILPLRQHCLSPSPAAPIPPPEKTKLTPAPVSVHPGSHLTLLLRRSPRLAAKYRGNKKSSLLRAQDLMCKKLKLAKLASKAPHPLSCSLPSPSTATPLPFTPPPPQTVKPALIPHRLQLMRPTLLPCYPPLVLPMLGGVLPFLSPKHRLQLMRPALLPCHPPLVLRCYEGTAYPLTQEEIRQIKASCGIVDMGLRLPTPSKRPQLPTRCSPRTGSLAVGC
uniref:Uncharacterized protein n=1 Tax=Ananas comosus var. bracteatus TaxID=296719 RepID=A0A6V7QN01_ANACO|nr:unnamed protein product [Ananas comosus var. bracteatus]